MDYYEEKLNRSGGSLRICFWCLIGIAFSLLAGMLVGCKTIKSNTEIRDSVRITDSIRIKDSTSIDHKIHVIDSIRIKDSTVIVVDSAGNVKMIKEYHSEKSHHAEKDSTAYYKNLFNDAVHELVHERNNKKEVKVEVEKPLGVWRFSLMVTGILFWLAIIIWIAAALKRKLF